MSLLLLLVIIIIIIIISYNGAKTLPALQMYTSKVFDYIDYNKTCKWGHMEDTGH